MRVVLFLVEIGWPGDGGAAWRQRLRPAMFRELAPFPPRTCGRLRMDATQRTYPSSIALESKLSDLSFLLSTAAFTL
jgi:hypothetical protein